ncbi:major facilitator superfamily [Dunaliella salina]|uniref:Major facilitator superfamily n=1 Tax=Dunaliella salina TaxID=3046 RepID=A0ABQ7G7V7_DUNSA|nr:major facilitator superfamily [Dunaliella salina]|eukprot:KAF5830688.1 major facilitator superfamily [Dunaliella salina]
MLGLHSSGSSRHTFVTPPQGVALPLRPPRCWRHTFRAYNDPEKRSEIPPSPGQVTTPPQQLPAKASPEPVPPGTSPTDTPRATYPPSVPLGTEQQQNGAGAGPVPAPTQAVPPPGCVGADVWGRFPSKAALKGFEARRLWVFAGITAGYMGLYFTRGSLTYTAPVMVAEPKLPNIGMAEIGAMTSAFPLAYGLSKFTGGVMGAKFSARNMLGWGLVATALVNIAFGLSGASVAAMTILWFINGGLQGLGAPASASILTRWFASSERGTYWGLWNAGANLGGFLTPVAVGYIAKQYGWQWGLWAPGAAALAVGFFTLAAARDSPQAAGYPPPEAEATDKSKLDATGKPSIRAAFKQVGATSWLVFYLMSVKGAADAAKAAVMVSGLEVGGFIGGTMAGFMSDWLIRSARAREKDVGHVGQRVMIIMAYVAATFGILAAIRAVPAHAGWLQWWTIAGLGFCIYGPQMLIGLCGAELVDKPAVGASQGLLGLVSYLGAANAGVPLSYVVNRFGWDGYFAAMAAACVVALCLLAPLMGARSRAQQQEQYTPALA